MNDKQLQEIRKGFPYLDSKMVGKRIVYLDNAATTQRPLEVTEAVFRYYSYENANAHRGAHHLSMRSTQVYDEARESVRKFINAKKFEEIIFTRNATEAINLVSYAYAMKELGEGDEILISIMEHHSNLCTWQNVCEKVGAKLTYIYLDEDRQVDIEEFRSKLTDKVKLVAITGASNTVGTCPDIKEITKLAKEVGARVLIDAAQLVAHDRVDVEEIDCDFLAFSGHKLLSPMGVGVLYAKYELLEAMDPFLFGGDMIEYVYEQSSTYAKPPYKFEAGTQNVAGAVGLKAAIDYIQKIGIDKIKEQEARLTNYAYDRMREMEYLDVYSTPKPNRSPLVLYNHKGIHPHDVSTIMDSYGIAIRSGHHCAAPLHAYLGINSSCRASFSFYNTIEEVDEFLSALPKVQEVFGFGH